MLFLISTVYLPVRGHVTDYDVVRQVAASKQVEELGSETPLVAKMVSSST